jgi:hypothetical protein
VPWFSRIRTSTTYCPGSAKNVAEVLVADHLAPGGLAVDPLVADCQVDDLFPSRVRIWLASGGVAG